MDLSDRIARGVKASLLARVVQIGSNTLLLVALTRYLMTPTEYGLLYFVLSIVGVAVLFGSLGVPKATARYITEYAETDERQIPHLLERSFALILGLAILIGGLIVLVREPIAALVGRSDVAPFLLIGAAFVAGKALTLHLRILFQGFNRVDYSAVVGATNGAARVLFVVTFVVLGFGVYGALAGYVVAFLIAGIVGTALLYWKFYRRYERADEAEEGLLRRVLEYSVPTTATKAGLVLDSRVDTILLGALAGPVAVGLYTLARQIADVCTVPAESLGFTITPTFGEQKAADTVHRAARLYERSLESVLLLYVPAAAGLVLIAEPAIRYVFSDAYLGAVPIVQLFSFLIVLRAIHKITGSGLDYLGLARVRAVARGTTAVGNVGLNLLLIPRYGALGAGIATVVTYTLYTLVNIYYIHREFELRLGYLASQLVWICAITGVMAGVVVLTLPYVGGVITLLTTIALAGAVWAVLSVLTGLIDTAEVRSFWT